MKLSVVILAKNEVDNIRTCIESANFADEIVVVDDWSTDRTNEIAGKLGAVVYKRKLGSDFSAQRNFGLEKVNGEWVLFLDADERVSIPLKKEILQKVKSSANKYSGFYLKRIDTIWNSELKYGEMGSIKLLRLGKSGFGNWKRSVHEVWDIKGRIGELNTPLLHYPHQNVSKYISSINKYSRLHSIANMKEGKESSILKIVIWPIGKFIHNYFIRLGFLDGLGGLVSAAMMSFSSFLTWSNIWLKQGQK